MKNDQLKKIHEGLDKIIESCSADLTAEGESKPINVERDTAIIMVCAAAAKREIDDPEDESENAVIHKRVMTEMLHNIAGEAPVNAAVMERLSELAYEFDEKLSEEFKDRMRELRRPMKGGPGEAIPTPGVGGAKPKTIDEQKDAHETGSEGWSGGDPNAVPRFDGGESLEGKAGFSATPSSLAEGKQADGSPVPADEPEEPMPEPPWVNPEGSQGFGFGMLPVRFQEFIPEEDRDGFGNWTYIEPMENLVYYILGREDPKQMNIASEEKNKADREKLEADEDAEQDAIDSQDRAETDEVERDQ